MPRGRGGRGTWAPCSSQDPEGGCLSPSASLPSQQLVSRPGGCRAVRPPGSHTDAAQPWLAPVPHVPSPRGLDPCCSCCPLAMNLAAAPWCPARASALSTWSSSPAARDATQVLPHHRAPGVTEQQRSPREGGVQTPPDPSWGTRLKVWDGGRKATAAGPWVAPVPPTGYTRSLARRLRVGSAAVLRLSSLLWETLRVPPGCSRTDLHGRSHDLTAPAPRAERPQDESVTAWGLSLLRSAPGVLPQARAGPGDHLPGELRERHRVRAGREVLRVGLPPEVRAGRARYTPRGPWGPGSRLQQPSSLRPGSRVHTVTRTPCPKSGWQRRLCGHPAVLAMAQSHGEAAFPTPTHRGQLRSRCSPVSSRSRATDSCSGQHRGPKACRCGGRWLDDSAQKPQPCLSLFQPARARAHR